MIRNHPAADTRSNGIPAAIAHARRLVEETHGTNLDPVIEALDRCLLTSRGEFSPAIIVCVRPDPVSWIDVSDPLSGQQLAARLLCTLDDTALAALRAAEAGGPDALVPEIMARVFTRATRHTLTASSAMAALIVVRGLAPFCRMMGRGIRMERLAS